MENSEDCWSFWVGQVVLPCLYMRCECCKDWDYIFERWRSNGSLVLEKWKGTDLCWSWKMQTNWFDYRTWFQRTWELYYGGCKIYFPIVPESEVTISRFLWKICWRLCGIKLLSASETCVMVGWSLAIGVYCGRWHGVARGGKIYKRNAHRRGLGG
jgi:hypothetical protein